MDLFGRHTYYGAHELKPGSLYLASRGDELQLVMAVEPVHSGDAAGIFLLKRLSGNSFSKDFLVITGERFSSRSQYMLIRECMFVLGQSVEKWRASPDQCAPIGAVYSRDGAFFIVAQSSNDSQLLVNCSTGQTIGPNMNRNFWTHDWNIVQKNINDEWVPVFSK